MGRTVFKVTVLAAWLVSVSWLIRYEAFPHWFDGTVQGYRELSEEMPAVRDTWMLVYAKGKHVGYLNSTVEVEEVEGLEELIMKTQLLLQVRFQTNNETLRFLNTVRLNPRHQLLGSTSRVSLAGISGELEVEPTDKEEMFQLGIRINDFKINRTVQIPEEAIISSPLMDQGVRRVEPGETMRIRTIDPFSMTGELQTIEVTGVSRESRFLPSENQVLEVTLTETRIGDLVLRSEVDQFGRVLWQETPFGLTFMMGKPSEAMAVPEENVVDPTTLFSASIFTNLLSGGGNQ